MSTISSTKCATTHAYNIATKHWQRLAGLPIVTVFHAMAVLDNDVILCGGIGRVLTTNAAAGKTCLRLRNPLEAGSTWQSSIPDMPDARTFFSLIIVDSRLVRLGGRNVSASVSEQNVAQEVYWWKNGEQKWVRLHDTPKVASTFGAAALPLFVGDAPQQNRQWHTLKKNLKAINI